MNEDLPGLMRQNEFKVIEGWKKSEGHDFESDKIKEKNEKSPFL